MYELVIGIQCVSIIVVFAECLVVFKNWRSTLHSYLFLACISILINNLGYLLELTSKTGESYFTALRLSYLGRCWIPLGLFLFVMELVRFRIPKFVVVLLSLISTCLYVVVLTTAYTGLYYDNMSFAMNGDFPQLQKTAGPGHHFWTAAIAIYLLFSMVMLAITRKKERYPVARKRLLMVIIALLIEGVCTVAQMLRVLPVMEVYDITMLSFPAAAVFMFIAIIRYRLLDVEMIARNYVVDELAEGIIAVDDLGTVGFYNKTALKLFPQLDREPQKVMDVLQRAIDSGAPVKIDERIYTPEENDLHRDGAFAGKLYALADHTEHYQYIKEIEEQKRLADDANRAKSAFLANMSHDIRTPINAVLGMDEMILRESSEQEILSYATDIQTAGRTLLSLINDILDFSKIEEGRMEILPVQYELSSVINDLVNMIQERAEQKGLKLIVDVDSGTPQLLYGDEIRIRQVALNLLTNAIKYTEKGEVRLSVGFEKSGEKEIQLLFRIADTGIGIKEEDMEKLFSPFTRIDETRNRSIEGTGLGMSIVRQLLHLMGSKLEVQSIYGKGSTFSFAILQQVVKWEPMGDLAVRSAEKTEKKKAYHELFHAPNARILVVDDTEINLMVIRKLLKKTQIQIDTVLSGREALIAMRKAKYDLVFIDHMMPEMDGIETLHWMKEGASPHDPTVYIALTANAVSGAREMYLSEGFTDYLSKPVEGAQLEEVLKTYLPADKLKASEESGADRTAVTREAPEPVHPEPEAKQEIGEDEQEIPAWLREIPGLDVEQGITNCGSEDSYLSVLTVFQQTAEQKAAEIARLYGAQDIENYTIRVHALKSSARIIGDMALSNLAMELENAGKAGDIDRIRRDTDELLAQYRKLQQILSPLGGNDGRDLEEFPADMRKEAFLTICEIAESMDYGMMEGMLRDLKNYRLTPEDEEKVRQMENLLMELDWDGIRKMAESA